jgi:predicted nucleic acid-binding protein
MGRADGALRLAEQHGLTVYDAAYLDLAIDVDAELATLDRDLARAAVAEGVAVAG